METRRFDRKNGRRSGKWEKVKEHCWKIVEKKGKMKGRGKRGEKRENWRKNWKKGEKRRRKVERREKERREGWEIQRAAGLLHDTANVVGIMPAISRPPLHEKRPCSNRLGKHKNAGKTKNAHLSRAHTGSSPHTDRNGTFTGPEGNKCSPVSQNSFKISQNSAKTTI